MPAGQEWNNRPMSDDQLRNGSLGSKNITLDTSIVPLGERAWRVILDHVTTLGDEAETTYLEVKSNLDLSGKVATAKIAKFLLGAANRHPRAAERHFHGYAVLVIGALKARAPGVPRGSEPHELEDRLRQYLGPHFPAFEFGRIGVDAANEVLFIIAQPPQDGQTIFSCHKSFQGEDRHDNLEDGAIYVRGTSNTRPARSGEVLALVERARGGGKSPISLEMEVLGEISRVRRARDVIDHLLEYEEEQFSLEPATGGKGLASTSFGLASSILGSSGSFSDEDQEKALEVWRSKKAQHLASGLAHFLGVTLPGVGLRVISRDRFVAKPHLVVTFHGCELFDYLDPDDADYKKAVEPVVRSRDPFGQVLDYSSIRPLPRGYPVAWTNRGEDAEVVLTPESFRPNMPWVSDQDDYALLVRDAQAESVEVTWVLTEDGNDAVTTGELQIPTADLVDAAELFSSAFLSAE